jgi:serine/threonine-protein kinase RsbW
MGECQELISLRFISELFFIDLTQDVVQKVLQKFAVNEDEVFWISLAVREAVINAIKHGNRFDPQKYVQLMVRIDDSVLHIEVTDQGDGFNIEEVPSPLSEENILKPSGRGIFYIRSFMDHVSFRRGEAAGTSVIMEKKLSFQKQVESN